jgi:hypothetical protein
LQHCELELLLGHIVATMTADHIATVTLDTIDTIVAFVIPLVALLT